jgi:hypothetical protein
VLFPRLVCSDSYAAEGRKPPPPRRICHGICSLAGGVAVKGVREPGPETGRKVSCHAPDRTQPMLWPRFVPVSRTLIPFLLKADAAVNSGQQRPKEEAIDRPAELLLNSGHRDPL